MKIEKYKPDKNAPLHFIKSDGEARLSSKGDNSKGTEDNPYTLGEYITMYLSNSWEGGYVENMGYIGKDENSLTFPESSEFDLWSYFSSVFSFLSRSEFSSSDISLSTSSAENNGEDHGNNDYKPHTGYRSMVLDGIFVEVKLLRYNGWAVASITATSYESLHENEIYVTDGEHEYWLSPIEYNTDGTYKKYNLGQIPLRYGGSMSICRVNYGCVSI